MLKKIGLGLLCCLIKEIVQIIIHTTMTQRKPCTLVDTNPLISCYIITIINNDTHPEFRNINNTPFLLMVVPNVLQGLSFLLVFMTILEFICAQAPLRLKGLLIGMPVAVSELFTNESTTWEVFHEVKAFLIFLSLMLYLCASRRYRYRLRDEVVHEQFLVEEIYERELAAQAEKHERAMKRGNRSYGSMNQ